MSLRIQVLTTTHDAALLELATACDTGSDAFRVDRSPEFFALSRALGDSTYYGAFRGDRLVGCFGVTLQKRFLGGDVRDFHYLHDVRVHPEHRGSGIYRCLLECVFEDAGRRAGWAFATILDSNSRTDLLVRGCGLLPDARPIGRTVHFGAPLFRHLPGHAHRLVRLTAEEAWPAYRSLACTIDFAPADEARFRDGEGFFLGLEVTGRIVAVAKVVDQSAIRKLVLTRPLPLALRVIDPWCRWRGRANLHRLGEAFRHAYLGFCVGEPGIDHRGAFLAHLSRAHDHDYAYAFMGLSEEEAPARRQFMDVALSSTTYAYGDAPAGVVFSFRELTLV